LWVERIGLYPVAYIVSHCIVSGINWTTYSISRDFSLIIFLSILLYSGLLLAHNIWYLKKEIKTEVVLQYGEKEVNTKDMIASVKKDWTKQKHKISEIKSIELYVKPEDYAVYYVINGEHTGKVWL